MDNVIGQCIGQRRRCMQVDERHALLADLAKYLGFTRRIDPESWWETGGDEGWLRSDEGTGLLIIRHRREVHAQIEQLLKSLEGTRWWDPAPPSPPG